MNKLFIYWAVIVCGGSVLAIELLGTRVIAPFYGASLYLWSALISVTLAALSLGYAIGGRWADRGARLNRFCIIIGIAGIWVAAVPWLRVPALAITETLGLRTAVLITATALFFPPLALLGMVSPYAIRLLASSLNVVGRTAGNLYALSTLASVAAAVATGFFLIPHIGVSRLLLIIGLLLMGTAVIGMIGRNRWTAPAGGTALVIIGVLLYSAVPSSAADSQLGIIAVEESAYAEIRVVELDGLRYLLIDGSLHSGIDLETWESLFEYVNVMDIPRLFFDRPGRVLLVGLGGGSVVKNYRYAGWDVDAVEIDPAVTRIAREYFWLRDDDAEVYHIDGRQYLITCEKDYDVIIMDAFGSSSIPFHLVTEEAFGLIRSRLKPEGILAMNMQAVGWRDNIVSSLAATASRPFKNVLVLPIIEPPDRLGNLVLLASDRELDIDLDLPLPDYRFSPEYDRAHAWDNRFRVDTSGVMVLTDDLNPIDIWSERVNLVSRREIHEYFRERHVTW